MFRGRGGLERLWHGISFVVRYRTSSFEYNECAMEMELINAMEGVERENGRVRSLPVLLEDLRGMKLCGEAMLSWRNS